MKLGGPSLDIFARLTSDRPELVIVSLCLIALGLRCNIVSLDRPEDRAN